MSSDGNMVCMVVVLDSTVHLFFSHILFAPLLLSVLSVTGVIGII